MPRIDPDCSETAQCHVADNMVKSAFIYVSAPIPRVRSGTNGMTPRRDIGLIP